MPASRDDGPTLAGATVGVKPTATAESIAVMVGGMSVHDKTTPTLLAASTDKDPERHLELPITRSKGADPRVVVGLGPSGPPYSSMPPLAPGDRIEISGELEVTTDASEPGSAVVRKPYQYDPVIEPKLVLADGPDVVKGDRRHGVTIATLPSQTCDQRRHHTLVVFDKITYTVPERGLPWQGVSHLNLVANAHHKQAEDGQVVLIGQNEPASGSTPAHAEGNMGKLNVVRYRGKPEPPGRRRRAEGLCSSHIPVLKDHRTVVYSLRLVDLKEGEQLLMRARLDVRNPHHYTARVSTEVVLADSPSKTETTGRSAHVAAFRQIGKFNGTNCLRDSTVVLKKFGTMRVMKSSNEPLFVNLVATSADPEGGAEPDATVRPQRHGLLEIRRFGPDVLERNGV